MSNSRTKPPLMEDDCTFISAALCFFWHAHRSLCLLSPMVSTKPMPPLVQWGFDLWAHLQDDVGKAQ